MRERGAALPTRRDSIPADRPTDPVPSGWLALAGLSLSMLLASLGTSIANVALPTLTEAFGASFQAVQWVVLAYLLATTTTIVGVGRIGDILGRRRLLLIGLALFAGASLACSLAPALWVLVVTRAAQGLGAAIVMALALALVGETVPKERTGTAMGLLGTMSALGTALGPSLGGALIAGPGWRAIFLVGVPIAATTLLLVRRHVPADRRTPASDWAGFDALGTLLLALTLGGYALAMTIGRGTFGPIDVRLLLAAACGAGLFMVREATARSPLIRLATIRDPVLSAGLATGALVATVMMATLVVGPFYLSRTLGLDAAAVGAVMSAGPLVVAMTGLPIGRVVDQMGARTMTVVGLIAMVAGASALSLLPTAFGVPGYLVPIVVVTFGYALFQTANNTAVMKDVPQNQRGVVSGMLNLSRNLGLITGTAALGAVFALASGTSDVATAPAGAVAAGMRVTFASAAVLVAVAIGIALATRAKLPHAAPVPGAAPVD